MRRGWSAVLVALCVLGMLLGRVPRIEVTFALLTARATNPNTLFAATSLYAPGSLQASPSGRNGALGWAAGQNGSGYKVLGLGNGTSSACPGSASPSYTTIGTATTLAYTDTNRSPGSVPQGTWYCYQVQTTYQLWSSIQNNPVAGAQVGVVATGVQYANVNASKLDTGDQFIFTFNQAIDPTTGPTSGNTVCSNSTTVWVGSTATTGSCATTEAVGVGKITGGTLDANARWAATYAWSNSNRTLTVTLGTRTVGNKSPNISTTTWTFTPTTNSAKLLSSTGRFHICDSNTGGGNCTPIFAVGAGSPFTGEQVVGTATATTKPAKTLTATSTSVRTPTATREPAPTGTATSTPKPVVPTPVPSTATPTVIPTKSVAPSTTATMTSTSQATPTGTATRTAISTATTTSSVTSTKTMAASPMPTHTAQPTQTASTASTKAVIRSTQTIATATGSPSPSPTQPEATLAPTATPPMPSGKTEPGDQPLPGEK